MRAILIVLGASLLATPIAAQTQQGATDSSAARKTVVVPEGLEFYAVTTEKLSSKSNSEGDRLALRVDEDVMVNGVTVIAKGALVRGSISEAKAAGRMGRGGKLNIRIDGTSLVDGQRVNVRSSKAKAGDDKTGSTVALTVLFGPVGLLKKGNDAEIKEGTRLTLFTDEQKTVTLP